MANEDSKDLLKNVDWKTVGGAVTTESSQPVIKKRLPKKIRQVPECYFLPRRSLPSALAVYGAVCAAGVGAGMLLEVWINKKIKDDSMGTPDDMMAYSSLSKIDTNQNHRAAVSNVVAANNYPVQDYLYEPSFEPDFPEYDSRDDPFSPTQASPKVNLKTVLGGLVSIVAGANKDEVDASRQQSFSTDVSFLGSDKNGEVDVHPSVARLNPEKSIPSSILKGAKGLAILTVAKAGAVLTYKVGTGLVVARRSDGSWSAPSAILSVGLGWGVQIGGELTDFIIVLHDRKAVKAFSSRIHLSLGAGLSAAAGPIGRAFEADVRASEKGSGICYTYSCSKGAFVGVSLEGNIVTTRSETNLRFYGDAYLTATDILFGRVERPLAAQPLYAALDDLFSKMVC
nr:unnamed protein product [Digitaria exilis]